MSAALPSPSSSNRSSAIRFIVCLGIVSLFADMTYEGARSVIGPFLQNLGASAAQVGLIAGIGEMIGASLRFFSGRLADKTRAYWPITFIGYGVNILAVPALAFAGNWQVAALLVALERLSKSIRGPARDVLLSGATEQVGHGWGFGLHASLDQTGAVLGPLVVAATVARSGQFSTAFIGLAIPATAAVATLLVARIWFPAHSTPAIQPVESSPLQRIFWIYVAAAGLLAAGFADFALLAYHFQRTAVVAPAAIPTLYAGAMAMNGLSALFYGKLFDRFGLVIIPVGIVIAAASLPLGFLGGFIGAIASMICWGAGQGLADATLRPGIARVVSMNKRGSAFGAFNGVYGIAWFAGSSIMGLLYDHSVTALVSFGIVMQLGAAAIFLYLWVKRSL